MSSPVDRRARGGLDHSGLEANYDRSHAVRRLHRPKECPHGDAPERRCEMPVLTVRRHDAPPITADTVKPAGDRLEVFTTDGVVYLALEDVRSIIAGEPASGDEPATDEGTVLLA